MRTFTKHGRCHVFGHDLPLDEGAMPFDLAIRRINDPELLKPHLFSQVDPLFIGRVQPGDIVVGGRNFCMGKPHLQAFIALASLDLSVLCESMPYVSLRGAISKGVPVLSGVENTVQNFSTGDELDVDFVTGQIVNVTRGTHFTAPALAPDLMDIVINGGTRGMLTSWLSAHPELA